MLKIISFSKYQILAISFFILLSCSKEPQNGVKPTDAEQYWETNVINKDFKVSKAINNGTDITASFNSWTFRMLKTDYYKGQVQASNGMDIYTGFWNCNNDYSKLEIKFPLPPTAPALFGFLNREWKFTKTAIPLLEFGPWMGTDAVVLHLLRK